MIQQLQKWRALFFPFLGWFNIQIIPSIFFSFLSLESHVFIRAYTADMNYAGDSFNQCFSDTEV